MSLDMFGFVDEVFRSVPAIRYSQSGARDNMGKWVKGAECKDDKRAVNLQPLSDKELVNLGAGGERIQDFRKIYINDGDLYSITPQDEWEFDTPDLEGVRFSTYMLDNRPWRNYCKCVVVRNDR